jgi:DNA-binding NarL/FixJ family response regulator
VTGFFAMLLTFATTHLPFKMSSSIKFTPRESAVIACLKKGGSNQTIADEMGVSLNTVKTHLKNIFNKMAVKSRQELLVKLLKRN